MENELDNPPIAATMGFSAFGMPHKGLLHRNKAKKKKNKKHLHSSSSKSEEATPASGASTTAFPHPEAPASNPLNRPRKRSREAAFTATTSPAVGLTSSQASTTQDSGMIATSPAENPVVTGNQAVVQGDTPKSTIRGYVPGGYIAPNGEFLSHVELRRLAKGVRDENGDTVYFQPSFIEGAWAKFEPRHQE